MADPLPRHRAGPYQRTALRSITPCSGAAPALSLSVPSRPRFTSGAMLQRAPARHVRASSPASAAARWVGKRMDDALRRLVLDSPSFG